MYYILNLKTKQLFSYSSLTSKVYEYNNIVVIRLFVSKKKKQQHLRKPLRDSNQTNRPGHEDKGSLYCSQLKNIWAGCWLLD